MIDNKHLVAERFAIPGVGGILECIKANTCHILIQDRCKLDASHEYGFIEIPAGKIREFENIFACLRREIKEETGLDVLEIQGEETASVTEHQHFTVLNFTPFSSAQNLKGDYPIIVHVFICRVVGELKKYSDETQNLRWISLPELQQKLSMEEERFYPMHVTTLKKYLARSNRSSQAHIL